MNSKTENSNSLTADCGATAASPVDQKYIHIVMAGCSGCYRFIAKDGTIHDISEDEHRVCPFYNSKNMLAPIGDQDIILRHKQGKL